MKRAAVIAFAAVCMLIGAALSWLWLYPPDLLRLGDGYAAKILCSNVFIAGRDPQAVLADDVQAPGNPLLKLVRAEVDHNHHFVRTSFFGFIAPSFAVYRGRYGCATVPDGDLAAAEQAVPYLPPASGMKSTAAWPDGEGVPQLDPSIQPLLEDADLAGPGARALLVVRKGRIVGEHYVPGFDAGTPLLGWSMTKTVNAALVGILMQEGKIGFADKSLFSEWKSDARKEVSVGDLMAMQSGLAFEESYGLVTDATRMLFLDDDMVRLPKSRPLAAAPGTKFSYSSGTAVLLSRLWMDRLAAKQDALDFPSHALFNRLGMQSAVLEADATGTYAGSSYLYATARDWARFAQFLLQDGQWQGQRLVSAEFMAQMRTPTRASNGVYGGAQAWLAPPGSSSNTAAGLPADTIWMLGHDGQSIAIIPSADIILVRLGLTPSSASYRPQALLAKILSAG